jgi:hypothetical protein
MALKSTLLNRYSNLVLLIILFFAGLLAFFSLQAGHDWGGDFALYLRQAQSLLDGSSEELLAFNTYAMENSSEGPPSNPQIGPHLYPWGFPLLLVPLLTVVGYNIMLVKVYIILFFLLSLLVCFHLFKPRLGRGYSLMLVALLAFNPYLVTFNDIIVSDIPFMFFSLLSILFIEKTLGFRPFFINKTATYLLTGFLILFSFLVRTNGIVLLGVLGIGHLIKWYRPLVDCFGSTFQKEWKELLPYLSFAGFMLLAKFSLPSGSGSHLEFLQRITPGKLVWNFMYYTELPAEFFTGVLFPMLLYGITLPFLVLGIWRRWRRMPDVLYLAFCAASMLIFVLWPPVQGLRFIFPLLPFYLYFIFRGLSVVQFALQKSAFKAAFSWASVFTISLICLFMFSNFLFVYGNYPNRRMVEGPFTPASEEVFARLKEVTKPREVVVFFKPRVLAFMADRQSLRITKLEEIEEGKGDYLLYYKLVDFGQLPVDDYEELRNRQEPVFENEEYVLYKLSEVQSQTSQPLVREGEDR